MTEVSNLRLWVLRAVYLLVGGGLILFIWPAIISHSNQWPHMNSVVSCMLGAVSILALIGLFYPLQMLPVLFFEILWKSIWMIAVAVPLWRAGAMDAERMSTVRDIVPTIILLLAIPWPYVWANYVRRPAEGMRRAEAASSAQREPA